MDMFNVKALIRFHIIIVCKQSLTDQWFSTTTMLRFVTQQLFYGVLRVPDRSGALETHASLWARTRLAGTICYREA